MKCPKCNKNFQQFVTADNLAGLCDDCFEKEIKKNETNKIFDYGISGVGNPHKECLKCGYVGTRKEFKYGVKESKDDSK